MKAAYPIVLKRDQECVVVYVPDFDINTQGKDYAEAIYMARDAIGLVGIDMEDDGEEIPHPSDLEAVVAAHPGAIVAMVDVDFVAYRRKNEMRMVRRNVTLPKWLNYEADQAGLNVSAVLQDALKRELGVYGK